MTSLLMAAAFSVSSFGFYQTWDWYKQSAILLTESTECDDKSTSPTPGCGRRA